MKAILIKDYLEQRMYFFIILAVAVVSLLVAAFFNQLDSGVALVILFLLQGPLFIYLAANHQISSEVNNGTWKFLNSLPVSRLRLWGAKLVFTIIYTSALYTVYVVLSLIVGVSPADLWRLISASPGMTLGMPMTLLAFGFFTTMLPQGFSTISALILAPALYGIFTNIVTVESINYEIATLISTVVFLALSLAVFMHDRTMTSPWRGFKGIAFMLAGIMLALGCWSALDSAAEHSWGIDLENSMKWRPMNGGKNILWIVETPTPVWDVIQPKTTSARVQKEEFNALTLNHTSPFSSTDPTRRLLMQNLETGVFTPIARRNSSMDNYYSTFNNGFATIFRSVSTFGFFRKHEYAVIDSEGRVIAALPENINQYSKNFKLIDDERFIYADEVKSGSNTITEFHLYQKGSGSRIVFSAGEDFGFSDFVVMPAPNRNHQGNVYITGATDHAKGRTLLVSAADGKKVVLNVSPFAKPVTCGTDFIVFDDGGWDKAADRVISKLVIARLDGTVEPMNWVATETQVAGVSATGKIIALTGLPSDSEWYSRPIESLVEIDPAARTTRELLRFDNPGDARITLTTSGERAILYYHKYGAPPVSHQYMSVDLINGTIAGFDELNSPKLAETNRTGIDLYEGPFYLGDNRFMIEGAIDGGPAGLFELDASSTRVIRHTSYDAITTAFSRGGYAK